MAVEHHWPGIRDAFAIPFRKFQKCREYLNDLNVPEGFWETAEGVELRRHREEADAEFRRVRLA